MGLRWAHAIALSWHWLVGSAVVAQDRTVEGYAQASRVIVVDSDRCDSVPQDELHKLIRLELAPRTVRSDESARADRSVTHAVMRCGPTEAHLAVADATRGTQQELTLDLTEIPYAARPRLLALSLSELVATIELEPTTQPPSVMPRSTPRSAPAVLSPRVRRSRAWLGIGIAREGSPPMLLPSYQAGIMAGISRWPLGVQGELQLHHGERSVAGGEVVSLTVSGSMAIGGQLVTSWVELGAGLGLRLGYARLRGDAAPDVSVMGQTVSGPWWGPTTFLSAVLPVQSRWGVRGGLDLTYVTRDVRGLDSTGGNSYSIAGFQLQANVGVCLRLTERKPPRE